MGKPATDSMPAVRVVSSGQRRRSSKVTDAATAKSPLEKEQRYAKLREFQNTLALLKQQREEDARMLSHLRSELDVLRTYETKSKQLEAENANLKQAMAVAQRQIDQLSSSNKIKNCERPWERRSRYQGYFVVSSKINKAISKVDKYKPDLELTEELRQCKNDLVLMDDFLLEQQEEVVGLSFEQERVAARKERRKRKGSSSGSGKSSSPKASSGSDKASPKMPLSVETSQVLSRENLSSSHKISQSVATANSCRESIWELSRSKKKGRTTRLSWNIQYHGHPGNQVESSRARNCMPEEVEWVPPMQEIALRYLPESENDIFDPPMPTISLPMPSAATEEASGLTPPHQSQPSSPVRPPPPPRGPIRPVDELESAPIVVVAGGKVEKPKPNELERDQRVIAFPKIRSTVSHWDQEMKRAEEIKRQTTYTDDDDESEKTSEPSMEPAPKPTVNTRTPGIRVQESPAEAWKRRKEAKQQKKEGKHRIPKQAKSSIVIEKKHNFKTNQHLAGSNNADVPEFVRKFKTIAVHHQENAVEATGRVAVGAGVFVGKHGIEYSGAALDEKLEADRLAKQEEEERLAAEEEARWEKEEEERRAREYAEEKAAEEERAREYAEKREREAQLARERKEREARALAEINAKASEEKAAKEKAEQEAKEKAEQAAREKAEAQKKAAEEAAKSAPAASTPAPPASAPTPPPAAPAAKPKKSFLDSSSDDDSDDSPVVKKAPPPKPPAAAAPAKPAAKKKSFFDSDSDSDSS
ncbi:expressed unknown protein [Seminavis robusta]|uniref:Uncharacterized protein n=1 Tax=Seminavis robusta TaxID=568900 RepID=A0A9N8E4M1_9STRA|nr:expressed unknown protein [Seminavis robusta]|eukprot:Sro661_g183220.1 n/a (758) ;mRNA; r:35978-38251